MTMAEPEFGARLKPLRKSRFRRSLVPGPLFPPNATLAQYGGPRMALPVKEPFPIQISEDLLQMTEDLLLGDGGRVKRDKNSLVFWQPKDRSCTILGVQYQLGEVVGVASDPCMECRCAAGDLFCSPRCCFLPAPLTPNRLQVQQHEQNVLYQVSNLPPPHPLYNIRNQVMPGAAQYPTCPACGVADQITSHLFNCPVTPTHLSSLDPTSTATFLSSVPSLSTYFPSPIFPPPEPPPHPSFPPAG
ncbi:hypothetical protein FHG87_019271 [Trinorchestia longiramus]|nr:hypothetical protein FHG87_019271 [Trinorchestia longiramus]